MLIIEQNLRRQFIDYSQSVGKDLYIDSIVKELKSENGPIQLEKYCFFLTILSLI